MDCHATLVFEQYIPSEEEQNQVVMELRKALEEDGLLFEINTSSMEMARSGRPLPY